MDEVTAARILGQIDARLPGESILEGIAEHVLARRQARSVIPQLVREQQTLKARIAGLERTLQTAMDARERALEERADLACQLAEHADLVARLVSEDEDEVETAIRESRRTLGGKPCMT